ncbi:MAG: aspartate kinase [Acidobacteria bacterium]|nr:aspartate kinase [Acidobacteriota bacterium]
MRVIVQKYGGTSVGTPERIRAVAERVRRTRDRGRQVAVVVSAMGQTTDDLLRLAHQVSDQPPQRELDMLLSTGEQVSIALLAMALEALGVPAISLTGLQSGIITDDHHSGARIRSIKKERVERHLRDGRVAIVAGFQGVSNGYEITTLGRGGSDTTAAALAAALGAEACEIFTDVPGVFTADPRIVPRATKLDCISYEEMLELAGAGAQVLHPRSVEVAKNYRVPLWVLSGFEERSGTLVWEAKKLEKVVVTGATLNKGIAKVAICGVPDRPGVAARVFGALAREGINVRLIIQSVGQEKVTDISLVIGRSFLKQAVKILEGLRAGLKAREIQSDGSVAEVSIVGSGVAGTAGVASRMFRALARRRINIQLISSSEIRIACIVDAASGERALRAVHDEFQLYRLRRRLVAARPEARA